MVDYRYPKPDESSIRNRLEEQLNTKLFYSWEIARILHNLGMNMNPNGLAYGGGEIIGIESKVKRNLNNLRVKTSNLSNLNLSPLYQEKDIWNYLKKCEKEGLIDCILERKLNDLIDKEYHLKLGR